MYLIFSSANFRPLSLRGNPRSSFSKSAAHQVFVEGVWDDRSDAAVGHNVDLGEMSLHVNHVYRLHRVPLIANFLQDQRDLKARDHRRVTYLGLLKLGEVRAPSIPCFDAINRGISAVVSDTACPKSEGWNETGKEEKLYRSII